MSRKRVWIVDGHNVIFAIQTLKELQIEGRGEEARRALSERLEVFAHQRGERVVVVFDGGAAATGGGGAVRGGLLEVVYARGGAGGADRHILKEAERRAGEGLPTAVITDDVQTLASRLPRGVRHLAVRAFWLSEVEPRPRADQKPVSGDFSEIERAMLAEAAASERAAAVASSGRRRSPGASPAHAVREAAAPDPVAERVQSKRARGRLRQERRLARRGGRAGGTR